MTGDRCAVTAPAVGGAAQVADVLVGDLDCDEQHGGLLVS
jgi:hypothetical protein